MANFNIYTVIKLLSSVVIAVMGISLFAVWVPKDGKMRTYRMSRRFLAIAYLTLAITGALQIWECIKYTDIEMTATTTLVAASFQAFIFTMSLINLVNTSFMSYRRIAYNLLPISFFSLTFILIFIMAPRSYYIPLLYIMTATYSLQLAYYVILFSKEYGLYRKHYNYYYHGEEPLRLKWIGKAFYLSTGVGIAAILSIFLHKTAYLIFIVTYTTFYVYFALKFINYPPLFHFVAQMTLETENTSCNGRDLSEIYLRNAVQKWIESGKFIDPEISLKSLSAELNTNPVYLSRHINTEYGQNFRSWINSMRISETQKLIDSNPNMPLIEIREKVGIPSSSTFYRHFINHTGMTPAEYRNKRNSTSHG